MDKNEVIKFFDFHSKTWDENMEKDDDKMNEILDVAKIESGKTVLDIACGTGVMIDYYIERNVKKVTGVDISSKMVEIAKEKFKKYDYIDFLCEDAEEFELKNKYDCVMIFNAFPHFPNPEKLINNLCKSVEPGGTLTVAHDRGRKDLDNHHKSVKASKISNGLISEKEMENIFKSVGFTKIYKKATDNIYIVSATKE